ncbi:hypothetical protein BRC85_00390 [Halobacteriales archaeon QS_1_69_70]|nr:MAG: hypothetical protein BRC85_00390 [Halobacteriales archaeon QS_1_69_70]
MASETDERQVAQLIDGEIGWSELRNDVLPDPKDGERFEVTRRLLEERVDFENPILLPLNDHLYAVGSDRGRIVKCDCGQEFCSLDENWKHHARVRVREAEADHREIYPEYQTSTPSPPATRSGRASSPTSTPSTRSGSGSRRRTHDRIQRYNRTNHTRIHL